MAERDEYEVPDANTPSQELFVNGWDIYRKMVDNDYLSHRGAYAELRRVLRTRTDPFSFLDVACGDASMSAAALAETLVADYTGIDLSEDAISRARGLMTKTGHSVRFFLGDFRELLSTWPTPADIVWIGLSLHHYEADGKVDVMRSIRRFLAPGGSFLIYEDSCFEGESRNEWLMRWNAQEPFWSAYSPEEWRYVCSHVHSSDFPETDSTWQHLGSEAGFSVFAKLFVSSSQLFSMYEFKP